MVNERSKNTEAVSGLPQGSVFANYCLSCTSRIFFSTLENKLTDYTDESTLIAIVLSEVLELT